MLQVKNISFIYHKKPVLQGINFVLNKGEHLAIAGESGSGKSTLLKLLYGELDLNEGRIFWNNEEILGPKYNLIPGPDYMKYVPQEFDLMPFTSVENNIGKFLSNFYLKEKQKRTDELIKVVELESFAKTKVKYLSGGQKQRVALARALAKQPEILLLDEPFSHIDNLKKQSLRRNLFKYLKEENITCIIATHDKDDIISYADKMLVLHQGRQIDYNRPEYLYHNPKNGLVASFFDEYNEFKPSEISDSKNNKDSIIVYPHELTIADSSNIKTTVLQSYFKGDHYLIEVAFNDRSIFFKCHEKIQGGKIIYLQIAKNILEKRLN